MRSRDWLSLGAGTAAVGVSIFAVGGVLRPVQAVVAVLVAISLGVVVISRRGFARVSPLVATLCVAAGLTALQLVPLPFAILRLLEPTTMAMREDGALLTKTTPSHALTNDVPATLGALVFFLTLLGISVVALRLATSEKGRYRLLAGVTLMCGATAAIVGVHQLFGLRTLYGIYDPQYATPIMMGPLLNGNSLACLMAVGATLGMGLAAYPRQPGWLRVVWLGIVAGCGVITVATVSRGATLSLIAGILVTIGVLVAHRFSTPTEGSPTRHRRSRLMTNALPMGIVATCMVALVIYVNAGNVERQLSQLSFQELKYSRSKFVGWRASEQLVEESPWVGVGRGAFESTFTRVHPASGFATYAYLENEYLQTVVDWGVPGALVLGFLVIWLAYMCLRRWRDGPLAAAALGALAVVAIQSNVDFGLEFLGLAAPITVVAASLAHVPIRELRRPSLTRGVRAFHVLGLAVGAILLLSRVTTSLDEDRRTLAAHPSGADIQVSVERHPLDYYAYAVAADLTDRLQQPDAHLRAIRLLNHAMLLHPTHPGLHRLAAQMLTRDGFVDQAAMEYAVALRSTPDPKKLVSEIFEKLGVDKAAIALPVDYPEPENLVQTLTDLKHAEVATQWLARVIEQQPKNVRACEALARLAQAGDGAAAEVSARRCVAMLPDYQTRLVLALSLTHAGKHELVIQVLDDIETWQSRPEDKIAAWLLVCDSHIALDHVDEAKRCLRRLDASPDMRVEQRPELLQRLEALQQRGQASAATGSAGTGSAATGSAATP